MLPRLRRSRDGGAPGQAEAVMYPDRRRLGGAALGAAVVGLAGTPTLAQARTRPLQAVAFDAFPIFDPRPIGALAEKLFPGRGAALAETWRVRQFDYAWLATMADRYQDFWTVTDRALGVAAGVCGVRLTGEQYERLMGAWLELEPWADVRPVLTTLRNAGLRLGLLSNLTVAMLRTNLDRSGLASLFDEVLSTDAARAYKPDPRAYHLAARALRASREDIAFTAFAAWDAFGAKAFGFPTYWANRLGAPVEDIGANPDATARDLSKLADFAGLRV
jgi:2-haloacid dehalogenase